VDFMYRTLVHAEILVVVVVVVDDDDVIMKNEGTTKN
jgi:hypothetical protein